MKMKRKKSEKHMWVLKGLNIILFHQFILLELPPQLLSLSPLLFSVSTISAGSAWRSGRSTAHRPEATTAAPATRSYSSWRSSPKK